jgi:RNA polymerase sigma-70 factor (ECF subfamily)
LTKIIRNLSLQRYKKNHAKKRGGGQVPLVYEELEHVLTVSMKDEDIVDLLNAFLADLPRQTRMMFMQRYFYLHSIQEIAKNHQLGESHVKMTLKRTRDALQRALEAEGIRV